MKYRLIRTEKADRQLAEIIDYVAEESGDYDIAMGVLESLENAVALLRETPGMGALPRSEALRIQGHRMLIVDRYLIFYRYHDETRTVTVTAFLHARQDYLRVLR